MKALRILLVLTILTIFACSTLGYYTQAVVGHLGLVTSRVSIPQLLERDSLPPERRAKLETVLRIRRFASDVLALPENGSYRYFAQLEGDYVVWNVVAAPAFSLNPILWCFPVAGCVPYRGYFDLDDAKSFADEQRAHGYDVAISGATAYSTLGWFADPVLSSMLKYPTGELAGLIFHELAHQRVYVQGASAFNEAFASFVEQQGVDAWLSKYGTPEARAAYRRRARRAEAFTELLLAARRDLEQLYTQHRDAGRAVLREAKASVFSQLQSDYRARREAWNGAFDTWMSQDLNNAHLALIATYHGGVPAFEELFTQVGADWSAFYEAVQQIAAWEDERRTAWLEG